MAIIDLCGSVGANTGAIDCDPRRANFKTIIIGGAQFDVTQYGTSVAFQAAFNTAINLATGASGKLYPFPEFVGITANTEANKEATFGNGQKITISEGRPSYTANLRVGTNLERQLRKFNSQIVPVFAFDDNGNVWGKRNAQGKFVGYQAEIFVSGAGFGDYNNATFTNVTISFQSASDFYDFAAFVNTDFDITNLEGLLDIALNEVVFSASNVRQVGLKFINAQLGNDQNLADDYDTELGVTNLWVLTNATTGAIIPLTSVTYNAGLRCWTVTIDNTTYNALPAGTKMILKLVDPPALLAAGITGVESLPYLMSSDKVMTLAIAPTPTVTGAVGSTFTLTTTVTGGLAPYTHQWNKAGVAIPGATSNPFVKTNAQTTDNGAYTDTVTDSLGQVVTTPTPTTVTIS